MISPVCSPFHLKTHTSLHFSLFIILPCIRLLFTLSTYFSVVPTCIVTKECSRYRGTDQRPKSDMLISSQGTCSILLTHCRNDCSAQEFGSKIFIFNTVWDSGVHIIPGPCANWVNLGNQNLFICRNTLSNILKFS